MAGLHRQTEACMKAQITLLLIIIVVVLIIMAVGMFLSKQISKGTGIQALRGQQLSREQLEPLKEYFTSCLDLAAKTGLELLGQQGGYLYVSQGGTVPDPLTATFGKDYLSLDGNKVAYAIYEPAGSIEPFHADVPLYPWKEFPHADGTYFYGYFGLNRLPELNRTFKHSIQGQLEQFTQQQLLACIDSAAFAQQGLQIDMPQPNITVTLGKNEVFYFLDWPIRVTDTASGASSVIDDFSASYPVRLETFINTMELLTDQDATDINFSIVGTFLDGITASVEQNVLNQDDVIFIQDPKSSLLNKPYRFQFARHNRAPALFYVHSPQNKLLFGLDTFKLCGVFSERFIGPTVRIQGNTLVLDNQALCPGDDVVIPLNALDPDEEAISFFIEVDRQRGSSYQLKELEVGRPFVFRVGVTDGSLIDYEELSFPTMAVTPK